MRLKVILTTLVVACLFVSAGCRERADDAAAPDAALGEVSAFTHELVREIESAPDPSTGVAEAHDRLNARRAEMASKIKRMRESEEYRTNADMRGRLLTAEVENVNRISNLRTQYMSEAMSDPAFSRRLDALIRDYETLFRE